MIQEGQQRNIYKSIPSPTAIWLHTSCVRTNCLFLQLAETHPQAAYSIPTSYEPRVSDTSSTMFPTGYRPRLSVELPPRSTAAAAEV